MTNPREIAPEGKVRYAVVGLGWISQAAFLPAFAHAPENSEIAALVSDDPEKLKQVGDMYDVELRYSYDDFDKCLESGKIDAVYIGLPNSMHRDYTERAARAGVHVLCEKPMADTEEDCRAMIDACDRAKVKLMIAYRLHFDEANLSAIEAIRAGKIGEPRIFNSVFTQVVKPGDIRLKAGLGGGPLGDIGIYCLNASRYLFGEEPIEAVAVQASGPDPRFSEVPEAVSAILTYPGGRIASFSVSFGAASVSSYQVVGTEGDVRMDPGYGFEAPLEMHTTIGGKTKDDSFKLRDQFAAQLSHFSECVLHDRRPEPDGEEGLADIRILSAIRESAESGGRPVKLEPIPRTRRPSMDQFVKTSKPHEPKLVHAKSPSGD